MPVVTVMLSNVRVAESTYPRDSVDYDLIETYSRAYSAGIEMPRITIAKGPAKTGNVLVDGRHRLEAMLKAGITRASANSLGTRTWDQIRIAAVRMNASHGRALTLSEKSRAYTWMQKVSTPEVIREVLGADPAFWERMAPSATPLPGFEAVALPATTPTAMVDSVHPEEAYAPVPPPAYEDLIPIGIAVLDRRTKMVAGTVTFDEAPPLPVEVGVRRFHDKKIPASVQAMILAEPLLAKLADPDFPKPDADLTRVLREIRTAIDRLVGK